MVCDFGFRTYGLDGLGCWGFKLRVSGSCFFQLKVLGKTGIRI